MPFGGTRAGGGSGGGWSACRGPWVIYWHGSFLNLFFIEANFNSKADGCLVVFNGDLMFLGGSKGKYMYAYDPSRISILAKGERECVMPIGVIEF